MMKSRSLPSALLTALMIAAVLAAAPTEAAVVTLEGRNDPAIDRVALAAAIDAVGPGDTVELLGVFQLDGEAVEIAEGINLEGVALDDDGDGLVNEDWADGLDNDADGLVDEDDWNAELRGVLAGDGTPVPETDRSVLFNRALVVHGLAGSVTGLTIEGIHFSGHFRAITLEPDTGSSGGSLCENLFHTDGLLVEPRIEGNRFSNVGRAVELEGASQGAVITGNVVERTRGIALILEGGEMGCPKAGGGFGSFPVGVPVDSVVSANRFSDVGLFAVYNVSAGGTDVSDNLMLRCSTAVLSQADLEVRIADNRVEDADFALDLLGPAPGGEVTANEISGGLFGMFLESGAEGFRIEDNVFSGVGLFEILLDFDTTGNEVIVSEEDRVLDFGTGNVVRVD